MAHLHHFCACLPRQPYVDLRPIFSYDEDPCTRLITGTVTLPSCLDASVRCISGIGTWRTEKAARKDAAFQTYKALYNIGLLSENLLPLSRTLEDQHKAQSERVGSSIEVKLQYCPWTELAAASSGTDRVKTRIALRDLDCKPNNLQMHLTLPFSIPEVPPLHLYWSDGGTFKVEFDSTREKHNMSPDTLRVSQLVTRDLTRCGHTDYTTEERVDFLAVFSPQVNDGDLLDWYRKNCGRISALEQYQSGSPPGGFVRAQSLTYCAPHLFRGWQNTHGTSEEKLELSCTPLPKRRNFLRGIPSSPDNLTNEKIEVLSVDQCTVDRLPLPSTLR